MLVVLEGCDGTGKSTVAQALKWTFPEAEIIHCTAETENTYEFFSDIINRSVGNIIVCDRFCYGQFVYQEPHERKLTKKELHALEMEMKTVDAVVYLVEAEPCEVWERLFARSEKTDLPISEIMAKFRRYMLEESFYPARQMDTTPRED